MPVNQSSHEKDSKAFILWMKVGKEVEFAKYAAITYVFKYPSSDIFNEPPPSHRIVYIRSAHDRQTTNANSIYICNLNMDIKT